MVVKIKEIILYPFLYAIYPILFLYVNNIEQVSYVYTIRPIFISVTLSLSFYFLFKIILKNKEKAGLLVFIMIAIFFSYFNLMELLIKTPLRDILKHFHLLLSIILLFLIITFIIINTKINLKKATYFLNVVSISLILICMYNVASYYTVNLKNKVDYNNYIATVNGEKDNINDMPDIYYIILDGYASKRTLDEVYEYDNSYFLNNLNEQGFFVLDNSNSNYSSTYFSLPSSLNMRYINEEEKNIYQILQNNELIRFLKTYGYSYIHFASDWQGTGLNNYADYNFNYNHRDEFANVLIKTTILGPFLARDYFTREGVLYTFSKIPQVQNQVDGPLFIFAHIIPPHPPYLFGSDGETVERIEDTYYKDRTNRWKDQEGYLNQLIFINKKVMELVNNIIVEAKIPPIIIIQSDHGPASKLAGEGFFENGLEEPSPDAIKERMGILNAYYLPGYENKNEIGLYDSITPVNNFRFILNLYFDTEFNILEDISYFIPNEKPYSFRDVSDIVN